MLVDLVAAGRDGGTDVAIDADRRDRHPVLRVVLPAARRASRTGGPGRYAIETPARRARGRARTRHRRRPSSACRRSRSAPSRPTFIATASAATAIVVVRGRAVRPAQRARSATRSARPTRPSASRSPLTRLGALFALFAHRDRRPARAPPVDPRSASSGRRSCARSRRSRRTSRVHRRAGAPARARRHDRRRSRSSPSSRRHPRAHARTRRRCSRSRAASASRSRSSRCRSPTSAAWGWRIPFALGARDDLPRAGDRPPPRRDRALHRARGAHRRRTRPGPRRARRGTGAGSCSSRVVAFLHERVQRTVVAVHEQVPDRRPRLLEHAASRSFARSPPASPGSSASLLGGRLAEARGRRPVAGDRARRSRPAPQMIFFLTGGVVALGHVGAVDLHGRRGRHRARHARRRALPHRGPLARRTRCSTSLGVLGSATGLLLAGALVATSSAASAGRSRSPASARSSSRSIVVPLLPESAARAARRREPDRSATTDADDEYGPDP